MLRIASSLALVLFTATSFADTATQAPAPGMTTVFEDNFEAGTNKWDMTDAGAWRIAEDNGGKVLELHRSSDYSPPVRSPKSIAWAKDVNVGDFVLDVEMRQTGREYNHRDLCIFFGRQDASHFYYVHLASVADDHANSIFLVNGAARVSIAKDRTNGTAWTDKFHHVRVARTGSKIEVFFDDMAKPVMVAEDATLGKGTVGLGSFDDVGRFDNIRVAAAAAHQPEN